MTQHNTDTFSLSGSVSGNLTPREKIFKYTPKEGKKAESAETGICIDFCCIVNPSLGPLSLWHWQCFFFTGPRCLWGPVYGSRSLYVTPYIRDFVKLCWCDSGWWWYQLNTIDDANLKRSLAIRNQCRKSHSLMVRANCGTSGGKMKYNSDYQKYGDTKIRNTTSWDL